MRGYFELHPKKVQMFAFGFDPKKEIIDKEKLVFRIDIDSNFPDQVKASIKWPNSLTQASFLQYEFLLPIPLN